MLETKQAVEREYLSLLLINDNSIPLKSGEVKILVLQEKKYL